MTLLYTILWIVLMTISSFKMIYSYLKVGKVAVWQMQFNPSKCEFLAVANKTSTPSFTYHINEIPIKAVQHAKYLGVTRDSKLTWKEHIKITTHKQTLLWHSYVVTWSRPEQLIDLIDNHGIINVQTIIVISIIHMDYKKSHQKLHYVGCFDTKCNI